MQFRTILLAWLLMLPSTLVLAESRIISIQGQGEVSTAADTVLISLAVETTAEHAAAAVQQNASKMESVITALKQQLGEDDTLATAHYTVTPNYQYDQETRQQHLTGYTASNGITVSSQQLDALGSLLDSVTQLGINRVNNLQFTHSDAEQFQQQALALAVQQARERAEVIAEAAGVALGNVLQVNPYSQAPGPVMAEMSMRSASPGSTTPIEAGELSVSARVTVVYGIQ